MFRLESYPLLFSYLDWSYMKKLIGKLVLVITLLYIEVSFALDITGHYQCRGHNFLNNTTFDEPTVVKKTGDTFLFTWVNKNIIFNGTAILQGNTLSTVFW